MAASVFVICDANMQSREITPAGVIKGKISQIFITTFVDVVVRGAV